MSTIKGLSEAWADICLQYAISGYARVKIEEHIKTARQQTLEDVFNAMREGCHNNVIDKNDCDPYHKPCTSENCPLIKALKEAEK